MFQCVASIPVYLHVRRFFFCRPPPSPRMRYLMSSWNSTLPHESIHKQREFPSQYKSIAPRRHQSKSLSIYQPRYLVDKSFLYYIFFKIISSFSFILSFFLLFFMISFYTFVIKLLTWPRVYIYICTYKRESVFFWICSSFAGASCCCRETKDRAEETRR